MSYDRNLRFGQEFIVLRGTLGHVISAHSSQFTFESEVLILSSIAEALCEDMAFDMASRGGAHMRDLQAIHAKREKLWAAVTASYQKARTQSAVAYSN